MGIEQDLENFVKKNQITARDMARQQQQAHKLVIYGETHVVLSRKASYFAQMIRDGISRYHASEHFLNSQELGDKVEDYLKGRIKKSALPAKIQPMAPVLDAIAADTGRRGLVFSGSTASGGGRRHATIFVNFKSSFALHKKAGRFTEQDKGHFHIGAFHGARERLSGSEKTTTQRLIADGFDVGVVRLIVDAGGGSVEEGDDGGFVLTAGEAADVEVIGTSTAFDLVPVLRRAAGGAQIGVTITGSGPFSRIKPTDGSGARPYNQYYDAIVFLP
ncbi:MAG: hypothetical protein MI755_17035 [Sphingomonadales bacterium]|nr:hypothetical protein [Sphingomonadales bacterium]